MSTSVKNKVSAGSIESVATTSTKLVVSLEDGRKISVPLEWYPRLKSATASQRSEYKLIGNGQGIHWPKIDEDLDLEGILGGHPSPQFRKRKKSK